MAFSNKQWLLASFAFLAACGPGARQDIGGDASGVSSVSLQLPAKTNVKRREELTGYMMSIKGSEGTGCTEVVTGGEYKDGGAFTLPSQNVKKACSYKVRVEVGPVTADKKGITSAIYWADAAITAASLADGSESVKLQLGAGVPASDEATVGVEASWDPSVMENGASTVAFDLKDRFKEWNKTGILYAVVGVSPNQKLVVLDRYRYSRDATSNKVTVEYTAAFSDKDTCIQMERALLNNGATTCHSQSTRASEIVFKAKDGADGIEKPTSAPSLDQSVTFPLNGSKPGKETNVVTWRWDNFEGVGKAFFSIQAGPIPGSTGT